MLDPRLPDISEDRAINAYLTDLGLTSSPASIEDCRSYRMAALSARGDSPIPRLSKRERIPQSLFYAPSAMVWLALSLRYGGATTIASANPSFLLGGLVGEAKDDVFRQCTGLSESLILPWTALLFEGDPQSVRSAMENQGLNFPIVAKGSLGCRGFGVYVLQNFTQLARYLDHFPVGARLILQTLAPYHGEAAVFYVRQPDEQWGRLTSLAWKIPTMVTGDGRRSVGQLIGLHSRNHRWLKNYEHLLGNMKDTILERGRVFVPHFSGSHRLGVRCLDGLSDITPALEKAVDQVCRSIEGFHFGRLDVRFADVESFLQGKQMALLEINGASAEPLEIWDPDVDFLTAYRRLMSHYAWLFQIGRENRRRGVTVRASWWDVFHRWRREKVLLHRYPSGNMNFDDRITANHEGR